MFEFLTSSNEDAIAVLKNDHQKVKTLFDQFEKTDNRREKVKIASEAIKELKIHAAIEEEIFYPAARRGVEEDLMNEADEEHHVAKVLIAELSSMSGTEDHYDAKFKVLAENVRHHIREEEGKMFPEARDMELDLEAVGRRLLARKQQLMKTGVPECAEERMVAMSKGRNDSPAQASRVNKPNTKPVKGARPAPGKAKAANQKVVKLPKRAATSSKSKARTGAVTKPSKKPIAKKR